MSTTHIGRYTLQGELGRGGMATVYRAYDPSFKREVALKTLPREFLHEPAFRARFEREAQTIGALEHPAIVPVYDYGEEDGQPYIVMRLMPGGSLDQRLNRGPLSLPETIEILRRLAPALDRAHAQGIIHRDLKPANILFDADGNPYISDFGIAKLTQSNTQLSGTGMMGTPAYMSPEQARGDKLIDSRADLYALGAMLYHVLSGKRPYESETPVGMAFKHLTEPPPRLLEARPDLPAGCDAVIAKAMAKDPADRYATAAALLEALESAVAAGTPQRTRTPQSGTATQPPTIMVDPGTVDRAPLTARPPSGALPVVPIVVAGLGLAALAAVALLIVTYITLYGSHGATPARPTAQNSSTAPVAVIVPTSTSGPNSTGAPRNTAVPATPAGPTAAASAISAATASPMAGATSISSLDHMAQVYVPAGPFTMGNDLGSLDQRPAHTVNLHSFWIDRTEVTNAMYALCVSANACLPPQPTRSISRPSYYGNAAFAKFPVLFVNWKQARAYCAWAGRHLPTEAEWEKAARGPDRRLYPWGNAAPDPKRLNFGPAGLGDTVAVGQYPSNASPYGALDMAGNAWEWVADWYDPAYYAVSPADNPRGPDKTGCPQGDCKVLRGGSWDSRDEQVTTTARLFYGPNDSRDSFTIRCAQP